MNAFDPIDELRSAGIPVDDLSDEHRHVLEALTAAEVSVLVDIGRRLSQNQPEVAAHNAQVGGMFF